MPLTGRTSLSRIRTHPPSQYKPEHFEALTYRLTVDKLVTVFGYPEVCHKTCQHVSCTLVYMQSPRTQSLRALQFDWRYMMRGLTIDKHRGNIVKLDRHKYVKVGGVECTHTLHHHTCIALYRILQRTILTQYQ